MKGRVDQIKTARKQNPLSPNYFHSHQPPGLSMIQLESMLNKTKPNVKPIKIPKRFTDNILQQVLQYQFGIYQGETIRDPNTNAERYFRHGEGILFLQTGYMIIGKWNYDTVEGDCIIHIPSGGVILCEMINNKLIGWVVTIGIDKSILCEEYHLDHKKERSMTYLKKCQTWSIHSKNKVETLCLPYGKVPPQFDQKLQFKLGKYFKGEILPNTWRLIRKVRVSKQLLYVGYIDEHYGNPKGLGVLMSDMDIYFGLFQEGLLHKYGRIIYSNGDSYQGNFEMGEPSGRGNYYYLETDETTEYYVNEDKVETGKTIKGRGKHNVILGTYGYMMKPQGKKNEKDGSSILSFERVPESIERISERMGLICTSMRLNEEHSQKSQGDSFPVPQLQLDINSPKMRAERKLSMPTPQSSKQVQIHHNLEQQVKQPYKPPSILINSQKQKEQEITDTLTFMKRHTEDIEVKLKEIPSTPEKDSRVGTTARGSKRRHKIFQ